MLRQDRHRPNIPSQRDKVQQRGALRMRNVPVVRPVLQQEPDAPMGVPRCRGNERRVPFGSALVDIRPLLDENTHDVHRVPNGRVPEPRAVYAPVVRVHASAEQRPHCRRMTLRTCQVECGFAYRVPGIRVRASPE
jgi:hypothetical protein